MASANKSSRIRKKNRRSRLTALTVIWFLWDVKELTPLFEKSSGPTFTHQSHRVLGGYSNWYPCMLTSELAVNILNIYFNEGAPVVILCITSSFLLSSNPPSLFGLFSVPAQNPLQHKWQFLKSVRARSWFGEYHVKLWDGRKLIRFAESAASISYCIPVSFG